MPNNLEGQKGSRIFTYNIKIIKVMAKEGLITRNRQEEVAVKLLTKAHKYLEDKLGTSTNLVFSRECSYGHDSFHAGFYRNDDKQVRINFRNLYGCSIATMIEVLGHEMRHALQHVEGMLSHVPGSRDRKIKGINDYVSGIWNGERKFVPYINAPWEIDARAYEKVYANEAIEALGIQEEVKVILPMGKKTEKDKKATIELIKSKGKHILLSNTWIKDKKRKQGGGYTFVLKSDLPKGFNIKKHEDNQWLYEQQDIIQFQPYVKEEVPYGGFELSELIY